MDKRLDLLLLGTAYTMDKDRPCVEAVGIRGEKIVFTGSRREAEAYTAAEVREYDGQVLMPGFIDTHVHVLPAGIFMEGVDLSDVVDIDDILKRLKERAALLPEGQWIFGTGFQNKKIKEGRFPDRWELDQVSTKHPIFVCHNDTHPYSFNTMALEMVAPDPAMPGVVANEAGELTGLITDPACMALMGQIQGCFSDEMLLRGCQNVDQYAIASGVTTVFGKDSLRVLRLREKYKDQLMAEFVPMWMGDGCQDWEGLDAILQDPVLREKTCVCAFADGSFDCYSAAVTEPYEGLPTSFGMLLNTDEELYAFAMKAHENGLQFSTHAIGDHAIEQVLQVYERILTEKPKADHRLRIEHFEMPQKASVKKAAELGVALGMQPLLIEICEGMDLEGYACFIGKERAANCSPYRSVLNAGILVGGGTDFPVTPMQPLHGIRILMENPNPAERITLMEGLLLNTAEAAKLGFLEDRKGQLKPGMDADIIALSQNPFAIPKEALSEVAVTETICRGKTVYRYPAC